MQPLYGHTTQETAYLVRDYPYGFRLRCQIRYWLESDPKKGRRFCSQTTNPKKPGEVWNAPEEVDLHADQCLHVPRRRGSCEKVLGACERLGL